MSSDPPPNEKDERDGEVGGVKRESVPPKTAEAAPEQMGAVEAMRLWLRLVSIS